MNSSRSARGTALFALAALATASTAWAATIHLNPGQSFEQAVEGLAPGDTLVVHAGDYADSGRISVTVRGTAAAPVVIEGAPGELRPHIRRPAGAAAQNTINIEGATHLTIRNLEISSNGGDAVNMSGNPAFITLEDLDIHNVDVGVNFRSSMNDITVRRNHIRNTGDGGTGTGEGMYVGCNDATCIVRNSIIENNWVHDTANSTQGDGIEIKIGSHSNVVRDNVIHDTGYPCILVYGTNGNPVNLIEGNAMWGCGDSAIQAASDAIIRNNLLLDSPGSNGFNSQSHQGAVPGNLHFVHNTVIGGNPCVRLSGWSGRPGLVFANNAIYCGSDDFVVSGLTGVTVTGNVIAPSTSAFPSSGYQVGQSRALDLTNASGRNVYPTATSRLIDAGSATYATAVDFNGQARTGAPDAGAYERSSAANPGWTVAPGFKNDAAAAPAPTVTLSASPTTVAVGGRVMLTWSSTNATLCSASGAWFGNKPLAGSEQSAALQTSSTFVLQCSGAGGTLQRTASVAVGTTPPPPGAPSVALSANPASVASGGQSTLTWSSTNATSCTAADGWSGAKASAGSQSVGPLTATTTFSLNCTGSGGSSGQSVTVQVTAPNPPTAPATDSGGGALGFASLLALLTLAVRARRRLK